MMNSKPRFGAPAQEEEEEKKGPIEDSSSKLENKPLRLNTQPTQVADPKQPSPKERYVVLEGILRKKGLMFKNERIIRLWSDGTFNYYHRDKPNTPK